MNSEASNKILIRITIALSILIVYFLWHKHGDQYIRQKHDANHQADTDRNFDHLRARYRRFLLEKDREIETSHNEWIYHRKKVEYLHPDVTLKHKPGDNHYGIFAVDQIPFGTVLSAEYPLLIIDADDYNHQQFKYPFEIPPYVHGVVQKHRERDPEFNRIWNKMPIDPALKHRFATMDSGQEREDYLRFLTTKGSKGTVYSVIDRIGFNLPQNAIVLISGKENGYKAVMMTTRDIEKGEEIVVDRAFEVNQKWSAFRHLWKDRLSSQRDKEGLTLDSNLDDTSFGFIGGCHSIANHPKDCTKRLQLEQDIHSGAIFDLTVILKFYVNDDAAKLDD